jgi:hypothetical protein
LDVSLLNGWFFILRHPFLLLVPARYRFMSSVIVPSHAARIPAEGLPCANTLNRFAALSAIQLGGHFSHSSTVYLWFFFLF